MFKLSVCLETVFPEINFMDRIESLEKIQIEAIEFWEWKNKDLRQLKEKAVIYKKDIACFTCSPIVSIVKKENNRQFLESVDNSVSTAESLGCSRLIVLSGNRAADLSSEAQMENIIYNLQAAGKLIGGKNITLLLEPLNSLVNHPGYFLDDFTMAFEIIQRVNNPSVKLLFDIYHAQIMHGNIIATIQKNISNIGHFHGADVPGRHAPGTGELNYENIFKCIKTSGYTGYFGWEFYPETDTIKDLQLIQKLI